MDPTLVGRAVEVSIMAAFHDGLRTPCRIVRKGKCVVEFKTQILSVSPPGSLHGMTEWLVSLNSGNIFCYFIFKASLYRNVFSTFNNTGGKAPYRFFPSSRQALQTAFFFLQFFILTILHSCIIDFKHWKKICLAARALRKINSSNIATPEGCNIIFNW